MNAPSMQKENRANRMAQEQDLMSILSQLLNHDLPNGCEEVAEIFPLPCPPAVITLEQFKPMSLSV